LSEILALIPARGGSRGILHKNSRFLNGKPLVQWTVEAAKQSKYLTRVVCSSDDLATLDFAESAGAEPLLRPQELADAGIIYNTELHCLSSLAEQGYEPDIFVRLQPTSPLRTADDIDACLWYINEIGEDACVSVCEPTDHPWLTWQLDGNGYLQEPDVSWRSLRQNYETFYRINGAVYAAKTRYWYDHRGFFGPRTQTYIMPRDRSLDIDSEYDWQLAEGFIRTVFD
jgi:N-acylneuraminate cytidylyltransferase